MVDEAEPAPAEQQPPARPARGLGRGLSSLLGENPSAAPAAPAAGQMQVPVELVRRNPDQPRKSFDETEIEALAQSIRAQGILQPILVRPIAGATGEYQIIAGERRWRAAQRAGLHQVPVVVREMSDQEALELGILENVQRQDLNAIEEAQGYFILIQNFNRTQDEIAQSVGKSRSHIANLLRLLALPESVRALVVKGDLSAGHARALLGAADPEKTAKLVLDKGLNVRQVEQMVRQTAQSSEGRPKNHPNTDNSPQPQALKALEVPQLQPSDVNKDPDTVALEADIASVLGLYVDIRHFGEQGGDVTIRYETLEQLDDICRRLSRHVV